MSRIQAMRTYAQKAGRKLRFPLAWIWSLGKKPELDFWEEFLRTGGGKWPDDFEERMDPRRPLEPLVTELLPCPPGGLVRILDVGAGPLTCLGKVWAGGPLDIVATDPLAKGYDRLLRRYGLVPLVRTRPARAERLTRVFSPDTFDLAHARNSLDHCYDAFRAIREMLTVVKPGAYVLLRHCQEEALHADYAGFHQCNFSDVNGHLVVWNRRRKVDVTESLRGEAEVDNRVSGPEHDRKIITCIRKQNPC